MKIEKIGLSKNVTKKLVAFACLDAVCSGGTPMKNAVCGIELCYVN